MVEAIGTEWREMAIIAVVLLAILGIAEFFKRMVGCSVETSRKSIHVSVGLILTSFPFFFENFNSVFLLCSAILIFIILTLIFKSLNSLHGVQRSSLGAPLFPVATILIFYWAEGQWLLFSVPMVMLTIPDALAALIGKSYDKMSFKVWGEKKSIEGSLTFMLTAFFLITLPLFYSGAVELEKALMIGFLLSFFVACVEAFSAWGTDNFFIPVLSYWGLSYFLGFSMDQLVIHLSFLMVAIAMGIALFLAKKLSMTFALGVVFVLYLLTLLMI